MIDYNIWYSNVQLPHRQKLDVFKEYKSLKLLYEECKENKIENKVLQDKLLKGFDPVHLENIKNVMYKNNIHVTNYFEHNYPEKLKLYEEAPSILYFKGNMEKLNENNNISLVGSRKCTSYGVNITKVLASELSKNNINIVSGMARGIDTVAHSSCIYNNGYTCAVLGSGLDIIYPVENKKLFENIIETGCVISEYAPGTQPLSFHFPTRNRIISQLSDLVIIVEAGLKSGSLITARLALDLGIDVMAVPGSIFLEQCKGSNKLIKDGAFPLTCVDDVYDLLNLNFKVNMEKTVVALSDIEQKIYTILSDTPLHLDDLINRTKVDIKHLYEVLFELQLKEEILCLAGNYYVRNNKVI